MTADQLLTVRDVAALLQEHPVTVRRRIARGEIRAANLGGARNGARYRIRRADVDRFITRNQHHA